MQEFMLLVRTVGDHLEGLSAEEKQRHVEKISRYIEDLMGKNQLKGAQPLEMEGTFVSGRSGASKDGPFNETREVIVGYFLVTAANLDQAADIARANPVLEQAGARIEVRPIKRMEGIN